MDARAIKDYGIGVGLITEVGTVSIFLYLGSYVNIVAHEFAIPI